MAGNTTWMVRAGQGASYVEDFLNRKIVAISWKEMDKDLSDVKELSQIKELLKRAYPNAKPGYINAAAGQIYRFRFEFQIGDNVVTYNPQNRTYALGVIDSDYLYNPSLKEFPHFRKVTWQKNILRDSLSTATKNSLGSIMTVFSIDENTTDELNGKVEHKLPAKEEVIEEKETLDTIKEEIEEKAHEFIKDKIQKLNWEQLQETSSGYSARHGL